MRKEKHHRPVDSSARTITNVRGAHSAPITMLRALTTARSTATGRVHTRARTHNKQQRVEIEYLSFR